MTKVIGPFPTPVVKIDQLLSRDLINRFVKSALVHRRDGNTASDLLSHTRMIEPGGDDDYARLSELSMPHLQSFGELLFAERLKWSIKEAWMNVLEKGGSQYMHTDASLRDFRGGSVLVDVGVKPENV